MNLRPSFASVLLVFSFLFVFATSAKAVEGSFAIINVGQIFEKTTHHGDYFDEFESSDAQTIKELQALEEKLEEKTQSIQKNASTYSPSKLQSEQSEAQGMYERLTREAQEFERTREMRRQTYLQKLSPLIERAVASEVKEHGLLAVFRAETAIYYEDELDISDRIVAAIDTMSLD